MEDVAGLEVVMGNLTRYAEAMHSALMQAADEIAHLLAAHAKTHHAWQPVTGATDASTQAGILEATQEYVTVALSAGMDYDVFLELARAGKWAWLWPAVEECKPQMAAILERRLKR